MADSNEPMTGDFDKAILRSLPPVLRAVITALGITKASDFLIAHGGVNVIIPKSASKSLGLDTEQVKLLRFHLRNHMDVKGRIWLPKFDRVAIQYRNLEIRKNRDNQSIRSLALMYKLSSRQIQNITVEKNENQIDIFNL